MKTSSSTVIRAGHLSARRRPAMPIRELTECTVRFAGASTAWRDGRTYLKAAA